MRDRVQSDRLFWPGIKRCGASVAPGKRVIGLRRARVVRGMIAPRPRSLTLVHLGHCPERATFHWAWRGGLLGLALAGQACGGPEHGGSGVVGVAGASQGGAGGLRDVATIGEYVPDEREPPPEDLDWSRCSLVEGEATAEAECATVKLPLDWKTAESTTIDVFVKRYRLVGRPRGQLWLLNGGPGASAADFAWLLEYFLDRNPDLEVYLPDHRGTGNSSRLACSTDSTLYELGDTHAARVQTCLAEIGEQYPEGIGGFSVSGAARDIGELVARTRHGEEPVYLYGVSYGTVWAQRYLQLHPEQPSGIILDSICAPGECLFAERYDALFDETGRALLGMCNERPDCAGELGGDAIRTLDGVLDALDDGHCAEAGLTRARFRQLLAQMLRIVGIRELIPAAIARTLRCSSEDVAALRQLWETLMAESVSDPTSSDVLGVNILVSEFMESPLPTREDAQAALLRLGFSRDIGPSLIALAELWPHYTRDLVELELPDSSVPMLMLTGGLDPQTPRVVAQRTLDHFHAEHQIAVHLPTAGHASLLESPLGDVLATETCGKDLVAQFLAAPEADIDGSCVDQMAEVDFSGAPSVVEALFGTDDAWLGWAPRVALR